MNARSIVFLILCALAPQILLRPASAQDSPNVAALTAVIGKSFGPTRQVEVRDPFYNLVAFTIVIPKDWFFEGTVLHGPGCAGSYYQSIAYRAYSPDGSFGVQVAPRLHYYYWEEKDARPIGPACKFFAPMSSADYAAMFVYRNRPQAQIDRNEPVLNLQEAREHFDKQNEAMERSARSMGIPPQHVDFDFTRTRLHFEWLGMREEEWLRVEMTYWDLPKSVFVYNGGPHPGHAAWRHFLGVSSALSSRRAPLGKLDQYDPALSAIISSVVLTAQFTKATNDHEQQLSDAIIHSIQTQTMLDRQNSQAFMDAMTAQHNAFMANQNRQFQLSQQNAADQMNRQGRQVQNFIGQMNQSTARTRDYQDALLDQQYYANPRTGETSTVSGRFNHAYANGPMSSNATNVLQTDSNISPGYNWVELMPIHH